MIYCKTLKVQKLNVEFNRILEILNSVLENIFLNNFFFDVLNKKKSIELLHKLFF